MGEQDATSKPVSLHSGPQIARLSGWDATLLARDRTTQRRPFRDWLTVRTWGAPVLRPYKEGAKPAPGSLGPSLWRWLELRVERSRE